MASVRKFSKIHPKTDVLVLNTGGPPAKAFYDLTEEDWLLNFNQLFLSFVVLLREIKVRDGGYVFLISSFNIREPDPKLVLSNSLRLGFTSVLKTYSKLHLARRISCINIAPGPIETDRLTGLLAKNGQTVAQLAATLPTGRVTAPEEIGAFVELIVSSKLTGLNGVTIPFDMGLGNFVL